MPYYGGVLFFVSSKGLSTKPLTTNIVGVLFLLIGFMAYLFEKDIIPGEKTAVALFLYSYSIAAIFAIAIWINLSAIFAADTKINAVYSGCVQVRGGLFPLYKLKFTYRYNNVEYSKTTSDTVGIRVVEKLEHNSECQVLISSKNPSVIAYGRKLGVGTWCVNNSSLK